MNGNRFLAPATRSHFGFAIENKRNNRAIPLGAGRNLSAGRIVGRVRSNPMSSAKLTTDHDEIRRWVEQRGGRPSRVDAERHKQGGGILRADFEDPRGDGDDRWRRSPRTKFLTPSRPTSLHSSGRDSRRSTQPIQQAGQPQSLIRRRKHGRLTRRFGLGLS